MFRGASLLSPVVEQGMKDGDAHVLSLLDVGAPHLAGGKRKAGQEAG